MITVRIFARVRCANADGPITTAIPLMVTRTSCIAGDLAERFLLIGAFKWCGGLRRGRVGGWCRRERWRLVGAVMDCACTGGGGQKAVLGVIVAGTAAEDLAGGESVHARRKGGPEEITLGSKKSHNG